MRYRELCPRCLNYFSDHPETCLCACHLDEAFCEMRYQLKKVGQALTELGEAFSKIQMP